MTARTSTTVVVGLVLAVACTRGAKQATHLHEPDATAPSALETPEHAHVSRALGSTYARGLAEGVARSLAADHRDNIGYIESQFVMITGCRVEHHFALVPDGKTYGRAEREARRATLAVLRAKGEQVGAAKVHVLPGVGLALRLGGGATARAAFVVAVIGIICP